jgi:hypothetical protein
VLLVKESTKFEFVSNLRAAKQIGLTIPPNVLPREDRVNSLGLPILELNESAEFSILREP